MINLELYRVFYTVAKCGSLTRAAKELYISQPAVSQSVKVLESQMGVRLFNRTHGGIELTKAGELVFGNIEKALSLIESAENSVAELNSVATGTIRIGATDSIFAHILSEPIAAFNEKYPAVKLELISSTSPDTVNMLKSGGCDVAFVNLPLEDDGVKLIGTVKNLSDIFVAGKKYGFLKDKSIHIKDLTAYPLLMIEENTVARHALASFTGALGITLTPDIEVANWDFMLKLTQKGMGIGCIPREYCSDLLDAGEIFELQVTPAMPARGVGLALSQNAQLSFALKQFIALFG